MRERERIRESKPDKKQFWTGEQETFLKDNFQMLGDKELSEVFQQKWPKDKRWNLKHIEKKRNYMNLKRSPDEIIAIHARNASIKRAGTPKTSRARTQVAKADVDYAPRSLGSTREKPIPSRPLNLQAKIRLQIDHKTWVYVDPDADFEAIKAKYKTRPLIKDRDDSPPAYQF